MNHTERNLLDEIENDDRWDSGELGRDEAHAMVVESDDRIDESLGLKMISIRLPRGLIEDFKFIGEVHGLKYQTLMRQIMTRFVEAEKRQMARKAAASQIKAAKAAKAEGEPKRPRRKAA